MSWEVAEIALMCATFFTIGMLMGIVFRRKRLDTMENEATKKDVEGSGTIEEHIGDLVNMALRRERRRIADKILYSFHCGKDDCESKDHQTAVRIARHVRELNIQLTEDHLEEK